MKKSGWKKKYVTILTICVILILLLLMGYILWNKLSLKERLFQNGEIRSGEYVDDMGTREGVSLYHRIIKMEYDINDGNDHRIYLLYVFSNGDIYSGDYSAKGGIEGDTRLLYLQERDERYWECVENQQYWGRLSEEELEQISNYLEQAERTGDRYGGYYDSSLTEEKLMGIGTNSLEADDSIGEDAYKGHAYCLYFVEDNEIEVFEVSYGWWDRVMRYSYNKPSHEAIDVIKSTWFYEQWTNQIFGEGWEERIDLEDGRED